MKWSTWKRMNSEISSPDRNQWNFPGKNIGGGCHFLLQGISLTQKLNLHLLLRQADSLPLSHLGSPNRHQCFWRGKTGEIDTNFQTLSSQICFSLALIALEISEVRNQSLCRTKNYAITEFPWIHHNVLKRELIISDFYHRISKCKIQM